MENTAANRARPSGFFWLLSCLTIGLTGSTAYVYGAEFVTVALLQQTAAYPFGGEGPTPWTYHSAARYAGFVGSISLPALLLFCLALWATGKCNQNLLTFICYSTVLLLALAVVVGMLGLE